MKHIELLAPAGSMEHLRAAVENGADAIYLGGKLFNARINAANFSMEEIEEAVAYAHLRNVKIYVTMNTLLADEELPEAVEYARSLENMGVDAVIVQDIGLAYGIKKYVPKLELHISTQMSVYNREGVRAVKKLGAKRVVLARELSLEEIRECCKEGLEVEVFGHGALCICYSGQCNMSRLMGGRSGNRGACAQSCRLRYTGENGAEKHWLSPKDLCTIDYLPELIEAGVTSLKIEGRMKSPEYVAGVVAVYRKYINMAEEMLREAEKKGHGVLEKREMPLEYQVASRDKEILAQLFNRGDFTKDYLLGRSGENLMSYDLPKHQGVLIGEVLRPVTNQLIEISLYKGQQLNMGDGVEIRCPGLPGNVVTYIKKQPASKEKNGFTGQAPKNARNAEKAAKSHAEIRQESLIIGDIVGRIKSGAKVYKITDKALLSDIRTTYENVNKPRKRIPVDMALFLSIGQPAKIYISERLPMAISTQAMVSKTDKAECTEKAGSKNKGRLRTELVFSDIIPEKAVNKSLDEETIRRQLEKCGEYPFYLDNLKLFIDDSISVPISALNRMRREALAAFCREKLRDDKATAHYVNGISGEDICIANCEKSILTDRKEKDVRRIYLHCNSIKQAEKAILTANSVLKTSKGIESIIGDMYCEIVVKLPLYFFVEKKHELENLIVKIETFDNVGISIMPFIDRLSRGKLDNYLRVIAKDTKGIFEKSTSSIMAGNIGWLNELSELGYEVVADYGMNITNNLAKTALKEVYGVEKVIDAMEFEELSYLGRRPLMVMDHKVKSSFLVDRKGKVIDAEYIPEIEKTILSQNGAALSEDIISALELLCRGGNGAAAGYKSDATCANNATCTNNIANIAPRTITIFV